MAQKIIGYREMTWTCPNCGTKNPGSARTCQSCGAAMGETTKFDSQSSAKVITDKKVIENAKKGPDIICAYCGNRNPAGTTECTRCGASLSEGHNRQAGEQHAYVKPSENDKPVICPACGTENPSDAIKCKSCGSELSAAPSKPSASQGVNNVPQNSAGAGGVSGTKGRKGCSKGCLFVLLIAIVFGIIAFLYSGGLFSGKSVQNEAVFPFVDESYTASSTVVDAVVIEQSWKTSVRIVGDTLTSDSGWESDMPSNATNVSCEDKLWATYDNEVDGSVEVCGDPYTVDLGNGYEALAQDCVYEVYEPYCEWTVYTQGDAGVRTASGNGPAVEAPYVEPQYTASGSVYAEYYVVLRDENGREYDFSPSNYSDYKSYNVGNEYILKLSSSGNVISMEEKE